MVEDQISQGRLMSFKKIGGFSVRAHRHAPLVDSYLILETSSWCPLFALL
jgi:hypothetical protein